MLVVGAVVGRVVVVTADVASVVVARSGELTVVLADRVACVPSREVLGALREVAAADETVVVVATVVIGMPRWISGFHIDVEEREKIVGNVDSVGGANSVSPLPSLHFRTVLATSSRPAPDTALVNSIAAGRR